MTQSSFGTALENKYPSYAHVFSEFDVDESYLYDASFILFVAQHEKGLKTFYRRSLVRGKTVLPLMKGLLKEDSVSDLFIYLSMIESGLKMHAVSPKKAVGLWQFMPATAKHYNLSVCAGNDERCDTLSSTSAALRYLNKLHKQFGKWYLAAMAYNCGEGRVTQAIEKAQSDELAVLIDDDAKYLPKETREYMKKILLIAMIGENAMYQYDTELDDTHESVEVEVDKGTSLDAVAKVIDMDVETLKALNVSLVAKHLREEGHVRVVRIPLDKIFNFYLRYKMPIPAPKEKSYMVNHRVALGESLDTLAQYYDTSKEDIKRANHLEDDFLILDSVLFIPISQESFEKL